MTNRGTQKSDLCQVEHNKNELDGERRPGALGWFSRLQKPKQPHPDLETGAVVLAVLDPVDRGLGHRDPFLRKLGGYLRIGQAGIVQALD